MLPQIFLCCRDKRSAPAETSDGIDTPSSFIANSEQKCLVNTSDLSLLKPAVLWAVSSNGPTTVHSIFALFRVFFYYPSFHWPLILHWFLLILSLSVCVCRKRLHNYVKIQTRGMMCLEEVKMLFGRTLSGKGRGWGALWLEWQQALLRRWWRECQAKTVRENKAPEPVFLILGGIQVKDTVRMASVATCWVKNLAHQ